LQEESANLSISRIQHAPADWTSFTIHNVHVGDVAVDFQYHKTADSIVLETKSAGTGECWINFSPALSPRLRSQACPERTTNWESGIRRRSVRWTVRRSAREKYTSSFRNPMTAL